MSVPQYLVQGRAHGEPWRTHLRTPDVVEATAYSAQLAELKLETRVYGHDGRGHALARYPYVRILHGKTRVATWLNGHRMRESEAVSSCA